jgi:hypothetical protein
MAQMSNCCNCENYNFKSGKCSYYINKIPKEILIELIPCEHYILKQVEQSDDNLPLAKGR